MELIATISLTIIIGWGVIYHTRKVCIRNYRTRLRYNAIQYMHAMNMVTAKAKELQDYSELLNSIAKGVDQKLQAAQRLESEGSGKLSEVQNALTVNHAILEENKQILKNNNVQLFHLKESAIHLYSHYQGLDEMLTGILQGRGVEFQKLIGDQRTVRYNLSLIDRYFHKTFNQTCEEYKQSKTNIVGQMPGKSFVSGSSLN